VEFVQFGAKPLHPSLVLLSQLSLSWVSACLLQTAQHPQQDALGLLHQLLIGFLHQEHYHQKVN